MAKLVRTAIDPRTKTESSHHDATSRLQAIREEKIEARKMERDRVEGAHLPEADALAESERWVDWQGSLCSPNVSLLAHGVPQHFTIRGVCSIDSVLAIIAPQQMKAYLRASITALYARIGPGIAAKDKPRLLMGIDEEISALEREEEALIRLIQGRGDFSVYRRREADISIVLDIQPDGTYNVEVAASIERESRTRVEQVAYLSADRRDAMDEVKHASLSLRSIESNSDRHPVEYTDAEEARLKGLLGLANTKLQVVEAELTAIRPRRDEAVGLADRVRKFIDEQDERRELATLKKHVGFLPKPLTFKLSEHIERDRRPPQLDGTGRSVGG